MHLGFFENGLAFERHAYVSAGHFLRQPKVQQVEQRRRNVALRAVVAQAEVAGFFADVNERNRIGGVRRVRPTRDGVDHLFGIAVVS